ncbi:MAG: CRP-like cAMP-binding protein [Crocinitomix sp.]|jgi:CRP-like cAMP-binding protein
MINDLIKYFEKLIPLGQEERNFISENVPVKMVPKNTLLLKDGDVSGEFYFMISGSARLFYNSNTGEKTAFFYFENSFVSSYESFTKQVPAKHNLQVMEDSTVAIITAEVAYQLVQLYPAFDFLARTMMEEELIMCQEIISTFITLSAEERYLKLIESNDQILQRIPQHQLATFLGITAETLSRIRKRIVS